MPSCLKEAATKTNDVAGECMLPAVQSADINAKFKTGDRVAIRCAFASGQNTLTRIEKLH